MKGIQCGFYSKTTFDFIYNNGYYVAMKNIYCSNDVLHFQYTTTADDV